MARAPTSSGEMPASRTVGTSSEPPEPGVLPQNDRAGRRLLPVGRAATSPDGVRCVRAFVPRHLELWRTDLRSDGESTAGSAEDAYRNSGGARSSVAPVRPVGVEPLQQHRPRSRVVLEHIHAPGPATKRQSLARGLLGHRLQDQGQRRHATGSSSRRSQRIEPFGGQVGQLRDPTPGTSRA